MPHVVTGNCKNCKYTNCVAVCPSEAFYEEKSDAKMLYINPDKCIDCGSCAPECPVEAIYSDSEIPKELKKWIAVNKAKSTAADAVNVIKKVKPLPTAETRKKEIEAKKKK
jgi:ferredoxin